MQEKNFSIEENPNRKQSFELFEFLSKHYKISILIVCINIIILYSFYFISISTRDWNWLSYFFYSTTLDLTEYMELFFVKIFNYIKLIYSFILFYLVPGILIANLL